MNHRFHRCSVRLALLLAAFLSLGLAPASDEPPAAKPSAPAAPPDAEKPKPVKKQNRLAKERSPYLLQHAENPVDWYPWGKEAFEKAKREDKPIFLSIGYSTCHWCHVMEHESFEDEKIAAYLNEHYVSIKVDREERPDVDRVYMDVCQLMNQRGGWPLSAFLLSDGRAFFAGTYFPPKNFLQLLERVTEIWKKPAERAQYIEAPASGIAERLRSAASPAPGALGGGAIDPEALEAAFGWYRRAHDGAWGGFGSAPKFPRTSNLDFLLRYHLRTGETEALRIVKNTLDHMIRGGMHDHLGGGFHRYSVDRFWRVPHFEKMLYDNALITRTLLDAWRVTKEEHYLQVARKALDYVLGRMRHPEGAFYSAEDADTEGREGTTYVWKLPEVLSILGEERGKRFADFYGVGTEGNFIDPHHREDLGMCVLHVTREGGVEEFAKELGRPVEEVQSELAADRSKLMQVRTQRAQPFLDDKILVEWNGLMISTLAQAAQVTGEARYLEAAQRSARFILDKMVVEGKLQRIFRAGDVAVDAFLEDHAFFIEGLLDLYEADFDLRWLEAATKLGEDLVQFFGDTDGAFFSSAAHHEALLTRSKEFYDGALPSGNSVAFADLGRLAEFTGRASFQKRLELFGPVAQGLAAASPQAHPQLLCALEDELQKPIEIVIVGPPGDAVVAGVLADLRQRFLPSKVVIRVDDDQAASRGAQLVPLLEARRALEGRTTVYICRDRVCRLPVKSLEDFRRELDQELAQKPQESATSPEAKPEKD